MQLDMVPRSHRFKFRIGTADQRRKCHIKPDQHKNLNEYSLYPSHQVLRFLSLLELIWGRRCAVS